MMFLLFDGRAKNPDTVDDATVMDTANTEAQARREGARRRGEDCIWYEDRDGELVPRWDLPPNTETK